MLKNYLLILVIFFLTNSCGKFSQNNFNTFNSPNDKCAEFVSPENSYITFESNNNSGFWVTVVDSLNKMPIPEAPVLFGKNPTINSGLTNENGSIWISSSKLDTVFVQYIGFQSQYYYHKNTSIDSVVIQLNECAYSSL